MLKKLWQWIKRPHGWALIPVYIFTAAFIAAAIAFTVVDSESFSFVAYIFYALAAISLGYSVYTVVVYAPVFKRKTVEWLKSHEFTAKLYGQYGFRTIVFAVVSFVISTAYAVFNGTLGIVYLSLWYGALGAYYLLLALTRGGVLVYHRRKVKYDEAEMKLRAAVTYSACGVMLILLPLALSFAILEMVISERAFVRAGMMIYVSAAYTFYKIITSTVNIFKARRDDDLTVQAIRNVNLADALVSVLALQTAMFHEFSPEESFGLANSVTGAVVCALTAATGVFMLLSGVIKIKRLKRFKLLDGADNKK